MILNKNFKKINKMDQERKIELIHRLRLFRLHGYEVDFDENMSYEELITIYRTLYKTNFPS